ncbi:glycosyltransferase family 4 protein [Actinomadura sp. 7K534]|uniref:glycosyltransferase family 4 protein n=1 Tax=Actinomadura sp. 7K534 TaxID=2530366 RepID=UPI001A9EE27D|nr:glycosyltransferase family 4 protein [Actinomadura sp. 7K534]
MLTEDRPSEDRASEHRPTEDGKTEGETVPAASRGRVVMLVDNDVVHDSRVQKAAASAAAAGWEVHLLGCVLGRRGRSWTLGGARVRLLPLRHTLRRNRHGVVRATLRRPLAYAHPSVANYRRRLVQSRRADLAASRIEPGTGPVREAWLLTRRVSARLQARWVEVRAHRTESLTAARNDPRSPLERSAIRFWQALLGDRAWRVLDRNLWDWDSAYRRVIDELEPDIIHANDFRMLGVGARAARRAHARGLRTKLVWDVHEFLPGMKPWGGVQPRWLPAMCAYEREYAGAADAVLTVSDVLADRLVERHGLRHRPTIVLNAPLTGGDADRTEPVPDLRELCGAGPDAQIAVYSGRASAQRGLDVMIEALPRLPGLHVALVVSSVRSEYLRGLRARAVELDVADRVHMLPYVPYDQVVPFLAAADIGVIPIHHWPNHEIALITKFFEYSHARLPIVVSDVQAMGGMVKATGQGEVFHAEDVDDYVRAVEAVRADPHRYRAVYDDRPELLHEWSWEAQAEVLDGVYSGLLPAARTAPSVTPAPPPTGGDLIGAQEDG